jgi:hypothetical protein
MGRTIESGSPERLAAVESIHGLRYQVKDVGVRFRNDMESGLARAVFVFP